MASGASVRQLARELECGVCLEHLQDPKLLDCAHTFCGSCLQGLVLPKTHNIICPVCQQSTDVPPGGVAVLKSNILVRSMVETLTTMNPDMIEVAEEAVESIPAPAGQVRPPSSGNSVSTPRPGTTDLVKQLKTHRDQYEQALLLIQERDEDFLAAASRARQDVNSAAEMIISDVRKKQDDLLQQLDFVHSRRMVEIKNLKMQILGVLDEVEVHPKQLEELDQDVNSTNSALQRGIENDLEKMKRNLSLSVETIDGLGFLKFSPEKTPAFNLHLGDLLEKEEWTPDLQFGKFGSKIGEFSCAREVAISPEGDTAITEQRNNRTCIFTIDGKHKLTMSGKSSGDSERGDRDVAFLSDGRCLILGASSKIQMYDRNGALLNPILTPVASPWCLAVDGGDVVYLGGDGLQGKGAIYVIQDGLVVKKIPVPHKPFHLDVDSMGRLLVSNFSSKQVDVISITTGEVLCSITSKSVDPSNSVSPWGACFGPDGSIFISFYQSKVFYKGTVHEFGPDGRHLGCVARGLQTPRGLGFTRDGTLIVVDGTAVKLYRKI